MIDIKLIRENPDLVKENIKKKFQDQKLVLVDEVIELDKKNREAKLNGDNLRAERKKLRNTTPTLCLSLSGGICKKNKMKSKSPLVSQKDYHSRKLPINKYKNQKETSETFLTAVRLNRR